MTQSKELIKGRQNKIDSKNRKKIKAQYDRIKDWKMDPKGYFLIDLDKKNNSLKVGYCQTNDKDHSANHKMIAEVEGKTAIEIINTLIKNKFLSSLQHAGDMGIELCKAELALRNNLKYIQDKDLNLS